MNSLISALRTHFPATSVITDELRLLAWGTDASFYRLIPQVVVVVESEDDVAHVLAVAAQHTIIAFFQSTLLALAWLSYARATWPTLLGDGARYLPRCADTFGRRARATPCGASVALAEPPGL